MPKQAGLTVRDLQEIPQIANTLAAGAAGLDRPVVWAHASEMPSPWEWLGADELLMTIGHCVPSEPEAQVGFVRALAEAGLAGVAIGDSSAAPAVSDAMRAEADRLGFPLLIISREIPFSVIARAVATANEHAELERLWRLSRLNVAVGAPGASHDLLSRVAHELGQEVHVVDARHGTEIWPAASGLTHVVREALTERMRPHLARLPARTRLEVDQWRGTCFPLPCNRPALLVVPDVAGPGFDPFVVLHLASLIGVEVERLSAERARLGQEGARLFRELLEGRLDSDSAARQLRKLGLRRMPFVVVAVPSESPEASDGFGDRGLPYVAAASSDCRLLLVEARRLEATVAILDPPAAGVSAPIHALPHVPDAAREARWALHTALTQEEVLVDYASARPLFLPRTVTEAQNAARTVLGSILDHDRDHGSDLVASLRTYLECDRSWARAAERLGIHRQTLGFRLAKIEGLLGRRLKRSGDIAECWLALQALRVVEESPPGAGGGR